MYVRYTFKAHSKANSLETSQILVLSDNRCSFGAKQETGEIYSPFIYLPSDVSSGTLNTTALSLGESERQ